MVWCVLHVPGVSASNHAKGSDRQEAVDWALLLFRVTVCHQCQMGQESDCFPCPPRLQTQR